MTENLELREWIAVRLMGWRVGEYPDPINPERPIAVWRGDDVVHIGLPRGYTLAEHIKRYAGTLYASSASTVPPYETDIKYAWKVVEAMRARGWNVVITCEADGTCHAQVGPLSRNLTGSGYNHETAPTAPLAICLAARAAIEGEG